MGLLGLSGLRPGPEARRQRRHAGPDHLPAEVGPLRGSGPPEFHGAHPEGKRYLRAAHGPEAVRWLGASLGRRSADAGSQPEGRMMSPHRYALIGRTAFALP